MSWQGRRWWRLKPQNRILQRARPQTTHTTRRPVPARCAREDAPFFWYETELPCFGISLDEADLDNRRPARMFPIQWPPEHTLGATARRKYPENVVPVERIELPTFGLQNRCSTAELNRQTTFNHQSIPESPGIGCRHRRGRPAVKYQSCPARATGSKVGIGEGFRAHSSRLVLGIGGSFTNW